PLIKANGADALHVARTHSKGKAIQGVDDPLLVRHGRHCGSAGQGFHVFGFGFFVAGGQEDGRSQQNEAQQNQLLTRNTHKRSRSSSACQKILTPEPAKVVKKTLPTDSLPKTPDQARVTRPRVMRRFSSETMWSMSGGDMLQGTPGSRNILRDLSFDQGRGGDTWLTASRRSCTSSACTTSPSSLAGASQLSCAAASPRESFLR